MELWIRHALRNIVSFNEDEEPLKLAIETCADPRIMEVLTFSMTEEWQIRKGFELADELLKQSKNIEGLLISYRSSLHLMMAIQEPLQFNRENLKGAYDHLLNFSNVLANYPELKPCYAFVNSALGLGFYKVTMYQTSKSSFEFPLRALKDLFGLDPNTSRILLAEEHNLYGVLLFNMWLFDKAVESYQIAIRILKPEKYSSDISD